MAASSPASAARSSATADEKRTCRRSSCVVVVRCRPQHQQLGRLEGGVTVGEAVLDGLEAGDGPVELPAGQDVVPSKLEGLAAGAGQLRRPEHPGLGRGPDPIAGGEGPEARNRRAVEEDLGHREAAQVGQWPADHAVAVEANQGQLRPEIDGQPGGDAAGPRPAEPAAQPIAGAGDVTGPGRGPTQRRLPHRQRGPDGAAHPGQSTGGDDGVGVGDGRQASTGLETDKGGVEKASAPAARCFRQGQPRAAHGAEARPQPGVVATGPFGRPDGFGGRLLPEERPEGVHHEALIVGRFQIHSARLSFSSAGRPRPTG